MDEMRYSVKVHGTVPGVQRAQLKQGVLSGICGRPVPGGTNCAYSSDSC